MRVPTAVVLLAFLFAGCADDAPPASDDAPRVSETAERVGPRPEPFATDLTATGMIVGPDGEVNTVMKAGFAGANAGNLTELRLDATWEPASLPLRVCLLDAATGMPVAQIPCVEGTGEAHIAWDNVTAGLPSGIPGTYRTVGYVSDTPQVIGMLEQHVEGVTVH